MAENSAFSEMVMQIQERLNALVPDIRMIDEDKGQFEDIDQKSGRPPVSWPCVLVDFDGCKYDDLGDYTQVVEGFIVLRLGFPPFSSGTSWYPKTVKQKALRYFDIEWQIYKALHGWSPDGFGAVMSRTADTEKRGDGLRVRRLMYELTFEEHSAQPDKDIQQLPGDEYTTATD